MGWFWSLAGGYHNHGHLMTWRLPLSRPDAGEAAQVCEWNGEWEVQLQCISRGIKDDCPPLVFYRINKLPMKYIYNILELSTKWWIFLNIDLCPEGISLVPGHTPIRWDELVKEFHVLKSFLIVVSISLAIQPWAQTRWNWVSFSFQGPYFPMGGCLVGHWHCWMETRSTAGLCRGAVVQILEGERQGLCLCSKKTLPIAFGAQNGEP